MPTKITRTPDYSANMARCGEHTPCVVCGRPVKNPAAPLIHVNVDWCAITEKEYQADPHESQGGFPIGPDCLRRHPELRVYAVESAGRYPQGE